MATNVPMITGPAGQSIPYFMWDRNVTDEELRSILADPDHRCHIQFMRVLLREARPSDVWKYVTPEVVSREFDQLRPGLGRRRAFWEWLLNAWRERGFIK